MERRVERVSGREKMGKGRGEGLQGVGYKVDMRSQAVDVQGLGLGFEV